MSILCNNISFFLVNFIDFSLWFLVAFDHFHIGLLCLSMQHFIIELRLRSTFENELSDTELIKEKKRY